MHCAGVEACCACGRALLSYMHIRRVAHTCVLGLCMDASGGGLVALVYTGPVCVWEGRC